MYLTRVELEKAIEIIKDSVKEIKDVEEISIRKANGRILANDYYANMDNPPFDRSPLDGYAIRGEDTKGANKDNPIILKEIDTVYAGGYSKKVLEKGQCIRIMTGAKMPEGSNSVIRLEDIEKDNEKITIRQELKPYDNYVFAGEDIKSGQLLMKANTKLSYAHLGVLASMGEKTIEVLRKPVIGILSTGSELTPFGEDLEIGKIYDSNSTLLIGRLEDMGLDWKLIKTSKDEIKDVSKAILDNINCVDALITTGGVSVGDKDIFHQVIDEINGEKKFWRVNIRPGTPVMYSVLNGKPILSLSGNPFAALVNFEIFFRPLISKMNKDKSLDIKRKTGILKDQYPKNSFKTRRFIRCFYEDGNVYLPEDGHSSGKLLKMIDCNGLIDMKKGRGALEIGEEVEVYLI